jgi:hypothetical protein
MIQTVYNFTVIRKVQRENAEIELKSSFEIQEEIGRAELIGGIFLADGGIPWDGRLTKTEKRKIEAEAYSDWEGEEDRYLGSIRDESCVVDSTFDSFDDDMAIKTARHGSVYF